jgi:hypothetical protein
MGIFDPFWSFVDNVIKKLEALFTATRVAVLGLLFMVFALSGGIYVIVSQPSSSTFLVKSAQSMSSIEMVVTFILIAMGAFGFVFMLDAFKKSYDLSGSRIRLVLGLLMMALSVGILEYLAYIKVY